MRAILSFYLRVLLLAGCCFGLAACVFYPKQESYYDPICQVHSKKFSVALNPHPILPLRSCSDTDCFDMLAEALIYVTAEAAVSTALVTVGNTAYFIDRQVHCIDNKGTDEESRGLIHEETVAAKPASSLGNIPE